MAFTRFLSGYYDVENQLPAYIIERAREYFREEEKKKTGLKTIGDVNSRRERIRKCFIESIGGLDIERTPLNPICTGVVKRDGYIIRNVIYESMPKMYVTANLYLPDNSEERAPAVLIAQGHSLNGKAYAKYQRVCIDLVRNGFAVLAPDPPGQGERRQYYDKDMRKFFIYGGIIEHSYTGLQCNLTGSNPARYFIWDLIRGIDYLCSLPEVDSDRIGMTGASGGGAMTAYMMVADERIKSAVPCNYFCAREDYMMAGKSQDGEMITYGAIADGIDMDDFITCFAPKPFLLGGTQSDFFCIEGAVKAYERGRRIYEIFGQEDNIRLFVSKGTHSFTDELRQAAVNWFKKTLKGDEEDYEIDTNIKTEQDETLWCTRSGQIMEDFSDAKSIWEYNLEYFARNRYKSAKDSGELAARVRKVLNMPCGKEKIYPRFISTQKSSAFERVFDRGSFELTDIFFFSEKGITVAGTYIKKEGRECGKCTILLLENGTKDLYYEWDLIGKLTSDSDVFVFDVRGTGAVESRAINPRDDYKGMYNTEFKLNYDAMMLKTSLTGLRVYDVLRACDFINEFYPGRRIQMAGKGIGAIYALFAAFLANAESVYLEDMIPSFENVVSTKLYEYDSRLAIHGILKEFDLPELIADMRRRNKTVVTCGQT